MGCVIPFSKWLINESISILCILLSRLCVVNKFSMIDLLIGSLFLGYSYADLKNKSRFFESILFASSGF
ncbi:MAG: hypothetical protein Ct9H90mP17_0020 [Actinomycetota bacterium]|nr:MAG: hypothetical protein Ct9H90mP17_0020 [Actinomycetota bacterium]